jgi:hypothetical protein
LELLSFLSRNTSHFSVNRFSNSLGPKENESHPLQSGGIDGTKLWGLITGQERQRLCDTFNGYPFCVLGKNYSAPVE